MESYVRIRGRGLKNLTYAYMGVERSKNCQNYPYVINKWPQKSGFGIFRVSPTLFTSQPLSLSLSLSLSIYLYISLVSFHFLVNHLIFISEGKMKSCSLVYNRLTHPITRYHNRLKYTLRKRVFSRPKPL